MGSARARLERRLASLHAGGLSRALALALCLVCPAPAAPPDGSPAPTSPSAAEPDEWWEVVDTPAAPFVLEDLDGQSLSSEDLTGRVVVFDFWATWCGPCIKELSELAVYEERVRDREDVAFLSLNVTDEHADLLVFAELHGIGYPIYAGEELLDSFEVFAFPTKLILDLRGESPGTVRFSRFGFTGLESIEAKVEEILAER